MECNPYYTDSNLYYTDGIQSVITQLNLVVGAHKPLQRGWRIETLNAIHEYAMYGSSEERSSLIFWLEREGFNNFDIIKLHEFIRRNKKYIAKNLLVQ